MVRRRFSKATSSSMDLCSTFKLMADPASTCSMLRESVVICPAIFVSGDVRVEQVNRAALANARFVGKPLNGKELAPFIDEVCAARCNPVRRALALACGRYPLAPREVDVLRAALEGEQPEVFRCEEKITKNTYKGYVRSLLDKTGADDVASLAIELLRDS